MAGSLSGKVVLVAGVGSGLGTATVELLASEGARVVAVARKTDGFAAAVERARGRGGTAEGRVADVTDAKETERVVRAVESEVGPIDALSIHVGHWVPGETLLHRMSPTDWSSGIRDNLDAVYQLGHAVLPGMVERSHGSVVLISAALAVRWAGSASYCAAKGGLVDLVPKLARDYRPFGVRFNAVLPGSIAGHAEGRDPSEAQGAVPLTDRLATSPWEIARAIRYFLSDESRWVTGALLTVDGGASTGGAELGGHG